MQAYLTDNLFGGSQLLLLFEVLDLPLHVFEMLGEFHVKAKALEIS
jgi:hypothetical protein